MLYFSCFIGSCKIPVQKERLQKIFEGQLVKHTCAAWRKFIILSKSITVILISFAIVTILAILWIIQS